MPQISFFFKKKFTRSWFGINCITTEEPIDDDFENIIFSNYILLIMADFTPKRGSYMLSQNKQTSGQIRP